MGRTAYLAVRNWDRYQHYKDGRPLIWIKLHIALLDDAGLRALPAETRLLWDQFLLLAGRTDNCIRRDPEVLAACTALDIDTVRRGTHLLVKGAWLRSFDSRRALELARSRERSREKRREETPKPPSRTPRTPKPSTRHRDPDRTAAVVRGWIEGPAFDLDADDDQAVLEEIGRTERRFDATLSGSLRAELLELAHQRRQAQP